ncbi:MAG: FprA family A-type flavoprotein [Methanomassiliicoccales archaeon]|nr:FprA family A-type flavoprotein [Methanomassiliicoccales archaeon]NYT14872.1 FprA family A-type flavoprotein [Methanomassiliicoccales archaeon]
MAEDVHWVGAIDWNLRNFHGYTTPRGSSYNAYLITDNKNILIDSVKTTVFSQLLERVSSVIDPSEIDLIISNHTEMDHSGTLMRMQDLSGAEILASNKGREGLSMHFPKLKVKAVEDLQEIETGTRTVRFIETPMLHWPDSMFSFLVEDGILFSMDGFGQHLASEKRFDDEVNNCILMYEAAKYYANILMPFGKKFLNTLEKVKDLDIKMLACSHGLIWRSGIQDIVGSYVSWANGVTKEKAVVVYDTMWNSTKMMAEDIAEGIASKGMEVLVFRMSDTDRSMVMKEILDARAVVMGSPTINNCLFPSMADVATYMKGLRPKGKLGAAFGSYGWGGGAVKELRDHMEKGGLVMPFDDLQMKYRPSDEQRAQCFEYGQVIGERMVDWEGQ